MPITMPLVLPSLGSTYMGRGLRGLWGWRGSGNKTRRGSCGGFLTPKDSQNRKQEQFPNSIRIKYIYRIGCKNSFCVF